MPRDGHTEPLQARLSDRKLQTPFERPRAEQAELGPEPSRVK